MPYSLTLPAKLRLARWKVKIRDREIREPPHVTIIRGTDAWRIDLRTGKFMDHTPDPDTVPLELLSLVLDETNWRRLREAWDTLYPRNPVAADDDEDS